ncbi:hypothetical protein [Solwaraspora sp. WMMD792]|uniref:hypothetical protein n=1 Tax=Solwaraspora sp. WMMD792 TaxID=3016099 RepID=UPI002415DF15|nr:hypothetical protein [Solwaraspora sp. WMMD792]MDG4768756.1 hypothetical protein [Solwaraspora sp. WMMD792]MDG4768795.1 hypothetical protein [Solwaraspora sp. WMMD792]MDG4768835.1 hypothetical protein [Solwaraspora sp. WMMD792]MDG4768849.1 hypothetical protein [Solwaraspora sp. WMMD792]MDG4768882.1 hypothetical protein [Solwaraspora sp. WMMD792]
MPIEDDEFETAYRAAMAARPGQAVYPDDVRRSLGQARRPALRTPAPVRPAPVKPVARPAVAEPAPASPAAAVASTGVERAGWLGRRWRWHATVITPSGDEHTVTGHAWRWATACDRAARVAQILLTQVTDG